MKISPPIRRDIIDALVAEKVKWSGRLEEPQFLARLFNLQELPSFDNRFNDAAGDIRQHMVNNYDWEPDWVFYDSRFDILSGDDEIFLRFLAEMLHPVVRSDVTETERLLQLFNQNLRTDGFELVERTRISGKPVFVGRYIGVLQIPGIKAARDSLIAADPTYIAQQITRIEASIIDDPALAIGTAKELVETCCKTILEEHKVVFKRAADIPELVKLTTRVLELTPDDIPDKVRASDTIKKLLNNLASITHGVAELRNSYGTGHGKAAGSKSLQPRHARLAAGAASTLAVFLVETHGARKRNGEN